MPTINDATVVAGAYDTSGNGGRKFVQLRDGTKVAVLRNTTGYVIRKSADNGSTWSDVKNYIGNWASNFGDVSIATNGTLIYLIRCVSNTTVGFCIYDINGTIVTDVGLDIQTALGNVSLAINDTGTELHATWASKNSAYPNSFNIRYAKGTINADGSVTWGAVEQVTTTNTAGFDHKNPSIALDKNGFPHVFIESKPGSNWLILDITKAFTTISVSVGSPTGWGNSQVYSGGTTYAQSSPSAIFVPQSINGLTNGRLWVAWHGQDSTYFNNANIKISYSDDGGITWSAMNNLTKGNSGYTSYYASTTANKSNEIHVVFHGRQNPSGTADAYDDINKVKYANGVWGNAFLVAEGKTADKCYASTLFDLSLSFTEPLFIYRDIQNSKVGFYGTWSTAFQRLKYFDGTTFKSVGRVKRWNGTAWAEVKPQHRSSTEWKEVK